MLILTSAPAAKHMSDVAQPYIDGVTLRAGRCNAQPRGSRMDGHSAAEPPLHVASEAVNLTRLQVSYQVEWDAPFFSSQVDLIALEPPRTEAQVRRQQSQGGGDPIPWYVN